MRYRLLSFIGILVFLAAFASAAQPGEAQAALTLNNFVGFETNGLDEALSSAGTVSFTNAAASVHSGDFAIDSHGINDEYDIAIITGGSTDSDNDFIVGFWIRIVNKAPSTEGPFFLIFDDSSNLLLEIQVELDDDIRLEDANSDTVCTVTDPFTLDTYHLFELRWQHSASAAIDVHIDGSSVCSETAQDLTDGGAIGPDAALYRIIGIGSYFYDFDDFYAYSGGTGTGDFLGDAEVFRYQNRTNSTTNDDDCNAFTNTLDAGVWQDLGETPLAPDATEPEYSSAIDGGSIYTDDTQSGDNGRHGPHGDTEVDGDSNIRGAKMLGRFRRGNGGGTTHRMCYGNDTNEESNVIVTLDVTFLNFIVIFTSSGTEPLSTEHFLQGFFTDGARDIFGEEMWSFILHVPDAVVTRRIFPVQ